MSLLYIQHCNTQRVEDEFHFLMVCPIYSDLRTSLLDVVSNNIRDSVHLTLEQKSRMFSIPTEMFKYIMGSKDLNIVFSLVRYLCAAFKCREHILVH